MKANRTLAPAEYELQTCCGRPLERAKGRLPTVAALLIAVASTLVLTFAG